MRAPHKAPHSCQLAAPLPFLRLHRWHPRKNPPKAISVILIIRIITIITIIRAKRQKALMSATYRLKITKRPWKLYERLPPWRRRLVKLKILTIQVQRHLRVPQASHLSLASTHFPLRLLTTGPAPAKRMCMTRTNIITKIHRTNMSR